MNFADLQNLGASGKVGVSHDANEIEVFLKKILDGARSFSHYVIIQEAQISTRLFLQDPFTDSINLENGSPEKIADELEAYAESARYLETHQEDSVKGWKISVIRVHGKTAALAEAVWC